jgi:hypothetical protein
VRLDKVLDGGHRQRLDVRIAPNWIEPVTTMLVETQATLPVTHMVPRTRTARHAGNAAGIPSLMPLISSMISDAVTASSAAAAVTAENSGMLITGLWK